MKSLVVKLSRTGAVVATRCRHATGTIDRMVGLLATSDFGRGDGMLIEPCKQVHTCFMGYPIDAVFVDAENRVVACDPLKPWRFSALRLKARKVLELPYGVSQELGLSPGDELEFTAEGSTDA
jgi:uncharacterized membrane protein (UPF0127 family)